MLFDVGQVVLARWQGKYYMARACEDNPRKVAYDQLPKTTGWGLPGEYGYQLVLWIDYLGMHTYVHSRDIVSLNNVTDSVYAQVATEQKPWLKPAVCAAPTLTPSPPSPATP